MVICILNSKVNTEGSCAEEIVDVGAMKGGSSQADYQRRGGGGQ